ncbi:probable long-chain-alcohol O-fatty-acyltransferase 5 [Solanum stenotomum]|uniref:probable long-chain-alcohol O-fatty-acyltransferase 5 n=1 Tax=Solanum stenotomum TaxID=172797 RepID=UPI0020D1BFA6|nr:probable long-chain-alcohol O-fatty-acyltransferase 5 [Solanum stenotomum]
MSSNYICFSVIPSLSYCYFFSAKIPKGIPRLISLLPIFYLFTILPLYFSSAFLTAITTFSITWLAIFKLVLFAFDQGPLINNAPNPKIISLPVFISIAALPLRTTFTPNQNRKNPMNSAVQLVIFAVIMEIILHHKNEIHPKLVLIFYSVMIFLMIDILIALSSLVVKNFLCLDIEIESPSNEPYFSTSLQDFWGRRWNLTVTHTLRFTVYNPVRLVLLNVIGRKWAQHSASLATFLVSGLMHELIFYYVNNGVRPSGEITGFFVLHGLCLMVEIEVKKALKDTLQLPGLVSGLLTVGFVVVTAFGLFFPPIIRSGVDESILEEVGFCFDFLKDKMLQFVIFDKICNFGY